MMSSVDAVITFGWCRTSYIALRSLTKLGVQVGIADRMKVGMSQWSRYNRKTYTYASPVRQPQQFITDLNQIIADSGATFLLPSHDETELIAKYRDRFPSNLMIPIASYEKICAANDKSVTAKLADELGIPTPTTLYWRDIAELEEKLKSSEESLVVKLRRSSGAKGVFYPANYGEAIDLVKRLIDQYQLLPDRYPIVQERIRGEGWGVSCLYWEGERIASFTHKRLREKIPTGGTSTLRRSARHPELEKYAHKMLDHLGWHGLAMVEFKYEKTLEKSWFIEINPRLWGSIALAVGAGIDFPALLYIAATQSKEAALAMVKPYKEEIISRWYLGDLILGLSYLFRGKIGQTFKVVLPGDTDIYDDIHWADPLATVGEFAHYMYRFFCDTRLNPEGEGMFG